MKNVNKFLTLTSAINVDIVNWHFVLVCFSLLLVTHSQGVLFASGFVWRTVIALALFIFLITSRREGPIEEIMTLVRGCVQACHRVQGK